MQVLQVHVSLFCYEIFLVQNSMILMSEVTDGSECWQLFFGLVVVSEVLLVFGVISGNSKMGNDFC